MKTHIIIICNLLLAVQTQGQSCSHCCEPGAPGTAGPDGIDGVKGPGGIPGRPGKHGMPGYSGEKGDLGPAGSKGQPGIKGNHGRLGLPGPDGLWHGEDGVAGDIGDTGLAGPAGIPGEQGHSGHNGHTGDDGPPGHPRALRPSTFHTIFDGLGVWATSDNFIIPFNLVIENEGSDYSRNTGKYTAPVNGTYFLSTTVHKKTENPQLQVSIELYDFSTSAQKVITYLLLESVEGDDSSTLQALVHLNANDQVFVTISREQALLSDTRRRTSFTGYLLMDDY